MKKAMRPADHQHFQRKGAENGRCLSRCLIGGNAHGMESGGEDAAEELNQ